MSKLLHVDAFSLRLGSPDRAKMILDNIYLTVNEREICALVGKSGSGKSMLAKAILRLHRESLDIHYSGSITLSSGEHTISLLDSDEKTLSRVRNSEIGKIFQQSREVLNPAFTIGEQLDEKATLLSGGSADKKTHSLLEEVGLTPSSRFYEAYPHQLSGGQIQRCIIALALVNDPVLLIADEPSSALDYALKGEILKLIRSLVKKRSLGVLLISHDLQLVAKYSDSVALIENGKIVENAMPGQLLTNPHSELAKSLLQFNPHVYNALEDLNQLFEHENAGYQTPESQTALSDEKVRGPINRQTILAKAEKILWTEKLSKSFLKDEGIFRSSKERIAVLEQLDIVLIKGEIYGIVGRSGSGKSTLARIIAGFESYDSGELYYKGKAVSQMSKVELYAYQRECQYIHQDALSAWPPHLSVAAVFEDTLRAAGADSDAETLVATLEKVGLNAEFLHRKSAGMSGGERQRVTIANALLLDPEILICDEIISALDVYHQCQIIKLLTDLNKEEQLTIIFISHDKKIIELISDHILDLDSLVSLVHSKI